MTQDWPTHAQAVDWLMKAMTKEYRKLCLADWRARLGDVFADRVEAEVRERWKNKK